ncbi:hypothetical protein KQX54_010061 [Cotesia glomerata]|uniref:Uncharacterized protein n=1 Tax=Cotesia glomerata TaxID=32391 RepID=A0AAV7IYK7_COTGL|nr:hypothetical protein KQX54_010061 [Cotesia glomerata]
MVKKCTVKNCMSGSIAERKMKLKQNNCPTALFQVPKNEFCPNGDIYDLSKARFDLKVGAIPVIVNNTTDVNMLQCTDNTNTSMHVNSEQMVVDKEDNDITIAED